MKKKKAYKYPVEYPYFVKPKAVISRVRKTGKTTAVSAKCSVLKRGEYRVFLNVSITRNTRAWIPLTNYKSNMVCKKKEWDRKTGMFKDKRAIFIRKAILVASLIIINSQMNPKQYSHEVFMAIFNKKLNEPR